MRWFLAVVLALVVGALPVLFASAAPLADPPPQVTITATESALDAPAQIDAGIVAVTFQNKGSQNHNLKFYRLKEGKTFADLQAASGIDAASALVDAFGGASTTFPGQSQPIVLDLAAGQYVLASFLRGPPDIAKALLKPLAVVAPASARSITAPTADVTVSLTDTAITGLPATIGGGIHTLQITNNGTRPAQLIVLKLASGKTKDDAIAWLKANQAGAPPIDRAANNGGTAEFSPGNHGWLTVDLTSGTWFAFNNVPGPNYNVPVFVTVEAPGALPASGGMDVRIVGLLGGGVLTVGWFVRPKSGRRR